MKRSIAAAIVLLTASGPVMAVEERPQWGFSLASGPYQPGMGGNQAYYRDVYASENDHSLFTHRPLMTTVEVDWYLATTFGLLGPFARFGYWKETAPTRVCADASGQNRACSSADILAGNSTAGTDQTQLTVFPMSVGGVYKFDLLKRYSQVPLVPFVKANLDYFGWRNTIGGSLSHHNGNAGFGATWGAEASAGLALNLDWIEPQTARNGQSSVGLTDSYLFAEAHMLWIDGFGDKSRLDFSGSLIQIGLAVDFD